MLRFRIRGTTVCLSVWFFACLSVWTIMGSSKVACTVLFLFAHEAGHLAAMLARGNQPAQITVVAGRFEIQPGTELVRRKDEYLILSAGCMVNFALALIFWTLQKPEFCFSNLALGCFNALPAGDLDGGKILRLVLESKTPARKAAILHGTVSFAISIMVMCVGFLVLLRNTLNPTVFLVGIYIFIASIKNIRYTS